MQRLAEAPVLSSQNQVGDIFNVLIVYEDFETGKLAKRTYDILVEHLRHECQFSNQMWKFEVLKLPKLMEMAIRDAQTADVLLVSCRGGEPLPLQVTQWLESSLGEHSNAIALVGLFGSDPESSRPVREYLAGLAKRRGIEFFASPDDFSAEPRLAGELSQPGVRLEVSTLSALVGVAQQEQVSRWALDN
jgi:hypothetical protein